MQKLFLKSIAVITSTLFIATNLSWANLSSNEPLHSDAAVHAPITSIQIPEALGTVQDQHISAPGSPFVVLIQDAHAVTEAQTQIQKLIQYLGEKYGISLAALEGTSGKMDATLLRAFPDEKVKGKILSEYLSRGEITGAEMAAVFNSHPTEFFGIEDMKLYEENYFAYLAAIKNQKSFFTSLEKSKSELDSRRKSVYSAKHNEFYLQVESFRTGKASILDLFKYFRGFDLKKYPNLKKICDLSDKEITKKNIHQISDIKGTELFGEMEAFISETENSFCVNQEQKDILESYRQNALLHDMASLELTKEQWSASKDAPKEFAAAIDFYHLALRRDSALHANLNQLLAKQKAKSAIVIAGGFHAEGFKEALKKSGYSYAVVLPALHSANGHENYAGLMQGNLSYKQYLKTSLYDAFLKDSSIKLARALDPRDAAQKMKYWRDEVIRMTARQGRVGDSGKYTHYIDSLNAKTREEILSAVRKVLDSFLAESLQKLGAAVPVSAKSSALIHLQAHPLMPAQSIRLRNFILAEKFSGKSLGMPQGIKVLVDQIKKADAITFIQRTKGLKWDSGQVQALRIGINPARIAKNLRLSRFGVGPKGDTRAEIGAWWKRNNNLGVDRTNRAAKEMSSSGTRRIMDDRLREYFIGVGPEGGDFSWFEAHEILHDVFLTTITDEERKEFLELAVKERDRLLERNKEIHPEDSRYFPPHVNDSNTVFGLNHPLGKHPIETPEDVMRLGEMFSRLGAYYLGYPYQKDSMMSVQPENFYAFFDKLKLRASEQDLSALLTSLTASARSLGNDDNSKPDDKTPDDSSPRAPPLENTPEDTLNPSLSGILDAYQELDNLMSGLTTETAADNERLSDIGKSIDTEEKILKKIVRTATDKGTAFPVIVEKAEDQIFSISYSVQMGMLSIPLVKANKIAETYALKGFADALKTLINKKLSEKGKTLAVLEDLEKPHSGYLGSRIVMTNILREDLEVILPDVVEQTLKKIKEDFLPKVIERKKEQFLKDIEDLHFYASHAKVYLPDSVPEGTAADFDYEKAVMPRIEKIREEKLGKFITDFSTRKRLTQEEIFQLSESKKRDYYRAYDEFLGETRKELSKAAKYWVEESEKKVPGARGKASGFIELLLEDGFKKLYERIETLEKVKNAEVRKEVEKFIDNPVTPVLGDDVIKKIKKRSITPAEGLGAEELSILFRHLQEGRDKTVPSFNYKTGRFPRIRKPLKRIYPVDEKILQGKINNTFLGLLKRAFDEFLKSKDDPDEVDMRLELLKRAYRNYRMTVEEALILSYRDPRLEQIYKLYDVDEVIEADELGLLEAFKKHLRDRAQNDPEWAKQQKMLIDDDKLKFHDLSELIHPGLFVFKRPVGDETGFVVRHEDGTYREGFAELNNGNAYFEAVPPDEKDSVYHKILIEFQLTAEEYLAKEGARKDPLKFMDELNGRILRVAPQEFPTTVKVEADGLERMPGYVLKGDGEVLLHPKYAVSSSGLIYVRQTLGNSKKRWLKTGAVTLNQLARFMAHLSASRIVYSQPLKPGKDVFLNAFHKLDELVGVQKQTELVLKVATSDEVEAIRELNSAASASSPRIPVQEGPQGKSLGADHLENLRTATSKLFEAKIDLKILERMKTPGAEGDDVKQVEAILKESEVPVTRINLVSLIKMVEKKAAAPVVSVALAGAAALPAVIVQAPVKVAAPVVAPEPVAAPVIAAPAPAKPEVSEPVATSPVTPEVSAPVVVKAPEVAVPQPPAVEPVSPAPVQAPLPAVVPAAPEVKKIEPEKQKSAREILTEKIAKWSMELAKVHAPKGTQEEWDQQLNENRKIITGVEDDIFKMAFSPYRNPKMPHNAVEFAASALYHGYKEARPNASDGSLGALIQIPKPERFIPVGDLQGRLDNFLDILSAPNLLEDLESGKAQLVINGDAIHPEGAYANDGLWGCQRGYLDSVAVVGLIAYLKASFPNSVHYLAGNHEFSQIGGMGVEKGEVNQHIEFDKVLDALGQRKDIGIPEGFNLKNEIYKLLSYLPIAARVDLGEGLQRRSHAALVIHAGPSRFVIEAVKAKQIQGLQDILIPGYKADKNPFLYGNPDRKHPRHHDGVLWAREFDADLLGDFLNLANADMIIVGHTNPSVLEMNLRNKNQDFRMQVRGADLSTGGFGSGGVWVGDRFFSILSIDAQTNYMCNVDMDVKNRTYAIIRPIGQKNYSDKPLPLSHFTGSGIVESVSAQPEKEEPRTYQAPTSPEVAAQEKPLSVEEEAQKFEGDIVWELGGIIKNLGRTLSVEEEAQRFESDIVWELGGIIKNLGRIFSGEDVPTPLKDLEEGIREAGVKIEAAKMSVLAYVSPEFARQILARIATVESAAVELIQRIKKQKFEQADADDPERITSFMLSEDQSVVIRIGKGPKTPLFFVSRSGVVPVRRNAKGELEFSGQYVSFDSTMIGQIEIGTHKNAIYMGANHFFKPYGFYMAGEDEQHVQLMKDWKQGEEKLFIKDGDGSIKDGKRVKSSRGVYIEANRITPNDNLRFIKVLLRNKDIHAALNRYEIMTSEALAQADAELLESVLSDFVQYVVDNDNDLDSKIKERIAVLNLKMIQKWIDRANEQERGRAKLSMQVSIDGTLTPEGKADPKSMNDKMKAIFYYKQLEFTYQGIAQGKNRVFRTEVLNQILGFVKDSINRKLTRFSDFVTAGQMDTAGREIDNALSIYYNFEGFQYEKAGFYQDILNQFAWAVPQLQEGNRRKNVVSLVARGAMDLLDVKQKDAADALLDRVKNYLDPYSEVAAELAQKFPERFRVDFTTTDEQIDQTVIGKIGSGEIATAILHEEELDAVQHIIASPVPGSIKGLLHELLWTHNTSPDLFELVLANDVIKADPPKYGGGKSSRGAQFRYGLDSEYGAIKIIMKPGFESKQKYRNKGRDEGANVSKVFYDFFKKAKEFYGRAMPEDELKKQLALDYDFRQYLSPLDEEFYLDMPAYFQRSYFNPQLQFGVDIDFQENVEAVLIPEHLYSRAVQFVREKGIKNGEELIRTKFRKVAGTGRSDEEYYAYQRTNGTERGDVREAVKQGVRRPGIFGNSSSATTSAKAFQLEEKMYAGIVSKATRIEAAPQSEFPSVDRVSESEYSEITSSIFKQHGFDIYPSEHWKFFGKGKSPGLRHDKPRKLWKLFINPNKEHFLDVLDRVSKVLEGETDVLGKIFGSNEARRVSGVPVVQDPNEPKMLLYFYGDSAKEDLARVTRAIEKEFSKFGEIEKISSYEGRREHFGKTVKQWGPSFTRMRNPLLFYTQGGYSESGRSSAIAVATSLDTAQLKLAERFEGENFYMFKGERDPFYSANGRSLGRKVKKIETAEEPNLLSRLSPVFFKKLIADQVIYESMVPGFGWKKIAEELRSSKTKEGGRGINMEENRSWGIYFYQNAKERVKSYSNNPGVWLIFEFEKPFSRIHNFDNPKIGGIYRFKRQEASPIVWRAVDFSKNPPSCVYVKGNQVEVERIQKRFLDAGYSIPVVLSESFSVKTDALYHATPETTERGNLLDEILNYGALLGQKDLLLRQFLFRSIAYEVYGKEFAEPRTWSQDQWRELRNTARVILVRASLEAAAASLGAKVDGIYQDIQKEKDVAAYLESADFERSVTSRLGADGSLLISQMRAVVTGPEVITLPAQLSEDAKFLLANPRILSEALKNKYGIDFNLKSDYVIDASFLHQADAVKFIQLLGTSAAVTFASGTPDADLASSLLHGTRRVGYGPNNILDQKKLGKMANPVLILPRGISFKFTEGSDWKKRGVEAESALVNPYETSEFVRLVEIILQTRKLKDNGVSFPVIDQEMLNSVVTLLNNLAKEELTQEALGRAA